MSVTDWNNLLKTSKQCGLPIKLTKQNMRRNVDAYESKKYYVADYMNRSTKIENGVK